MPVGVGAIVSVRISTNSLELTESEPNYSKASQPMKTSSTFLVILSARELP